MKTLYFEGAGMFGTDRDGDVGNCRIRTAFSLNNGLRVYMELCGWNRQTKKINRGLEKRCVHCYVDYLHYITNETDENGFGLDDENIHRLPQERNISFEYTVANILNFVNSLGASFDKVEVVPDLAGYRVFKDFETGWHKGGNINRYNYGDEFVYDVEMTARRSAVYSRIYSIEENYIKSSGNNGRCPNFSLWIDQNLGVLHLLRHFNGYNKHWEIRTDVGDCIDDWMSTMVETKLGRFAC